MVILSFMYKNTMTAMLCSNVLLTLPMLDHVILKNETYVDHIDLVSEGYFIIKQKSGIDCLNLPTTSSLRCLCETTLIFALMSEDILTDSFDSTFEEFYHRHEVFQMLDAVEQHRLYRFAQMMRVINRLFWKRKLKGNFIALAACATEGDHVTYNTGGASNVKTKCREIIFHDVTGIPIIPRPRRIVHKEEVDTPEHGSARKRKIDHHQAELDDKLTACLYSFRSDLMKEAGRPTEKRFSGKGNKAGTTAPIGSPLSPRHAYKSPPRSRTCLIP